MKYIRYSVQGKEKFGVFDGTEVEETGDYFTDYKAKKKRFDISDIKFLSPCVPTKIIAIGLNYRKHAAEFGDEAPESPIIFLKPPSAVIAHNENIIYPSMAGQVDYEAELGVVIKKTAKNVQVRDAKKYILGYTCFNDVTARDLQKKDGQWTRAKSFDTFAPIGPVITDEIDPMNASVRLFLNTEMKQNNSTQDMIFDIYYLVSFISKIMTLLPGDVIATGTPSGVGPMSKGDEASVVIDGIGRLTNRVV